MRFAILIQLFKELFKLAKSSRFCWFNSHQPAADEMIVCDLLFSLRGERLSLSFRECKGKNSFPFCNTLGRIFLSFFQNLFKA